MSDPFVAEIRIVGFQFAPKGWALCDGQLLPITQNTALFSLLGTYYGGDGKSTFALPNLQGQAAMQQGQGAGLSDRFLGGSGGEQYVTLITSEMPAHNHTAVGTSTPANKNTPVAFTWAQAGVARQPILNYVTDPGTRPTMAFQALSVAGGSLPHNNMPPYLVMNYVIAMQGVFPARP
jgi:microcystin-dependent protein